MNYKRSLFLSAMQALLAVVLLAPAVAGAQIYQWKDESGKVHFSDRPPEDKKTAVKQLREAPPRPSKPYLPSSGASSDADGAGPGDAEGGENIVVIDPEEVERQERQREQDCQRARGYLKVLRSEDKINMPDASGELKPVDQAQRASETRRTLEFIQQNCQG